MLESNKYFYDDNSVRYQLVKSNPGATNTDWLFLPGGPGVDSCYFLTLINQIDVQGNFWLIDFPENGTNVSEKAKPDFNFDCWGDCLLTAVRRFDNPILVSHSFSGEFALLFPELEEMLKGFIVLNSAPCLWLEEAAKCAKENNMPSCMEQIAEFENNPCPETFKTVLLACAPYYFPTSTLEVGKKLLEATPMNYFATLWWLKKVQEINYTAKWIPENIPTLILGASHDFITPCTLFENDERFKRPNILMKKIDNAGHFPWIEQMDAVQNVLTEFDDFRTSTIGNTAADLRMSL